MFQQVFIIEHEEEDINSLRIALQVVFDRNQIVVIEKIEDVLGRLVEENISTEKKYIAFIDILWQHRAKKGLELAKTIRRRYPQFKLVALTGVGEEGSIEQYVELFDAIVDKTTAAPHKCAVAIPLVDRQFLQKIADGTYSYPLGANRKESFTANERDLKEMISQLGIVVVSALSEELDYLYDLPLGWSEPQSQPDGVTYRYGNLNGGVKIVASCAGCMGLTATAILTAKILKEWKPRMAAMIGVCGGRKEKGLSIGDIVVPDKCFHYQFGAFKDGKIERELRVENPHHQTLQFIEHQIRRTQVLSEIDNEVPRGCLRPKTRLAAKIGPMGSADLVVKDIKKFGDAVSADRNTIAVDMESYAFMKAARLSSTEKFFVIKSVSDYADAAKDDEYREYSKFTAVRLFYKIVSKLTAESN
jgi:nucleoside phosphorylase/DNA-binding NarL/FixJ family response regulator